MSNNTYPQLPSQGIAKKAIKYILIGGGNKCLLAITVS